MRIASSGLPQTHHNAIPPNNAGMWPIVAAAGVGTSHIRSKRKAADLPAQITPGSTGPAKYPFAGAPTADTGAATAGYHRLSHATWYRLDPPAGDLEQTLPPAPEQQDLVKDQDNAVSKVRES